MDWAFSANVLGFLEERQTPVPAPETFAFFPGDPHVKKFGTIWARGREKILQEKNQVSYHSIQI